MKLEGTRRLFETFFKKVQEHRTIFSEILENYAFQGKKGINS